MNLKDSIENIKYLATINLNDTSSYDTIYNILSHTSLPYTFVTLRKGAYLFRARRKINNQTFSFKDDLKYRSDINNIIEFGRANTPRQSLFYASNELNAAVFETSSLIRDNRTDVKIESLIVGRWLVNKDILLLAILNNPEAIIKNKEYKHLNEIMQFDISNIDPDQKWILNYFSKEFSKRSLGNHNNYKISAAYYNVMEKFSKVKIYGVMYPSVEFAYNDINVALVPPIVDDVLILDMVSEFLIDYNYDIKRIIQVGLGDTQKFNIKNIIGPTHNTWYK